MIFYDDGRQNETCAINGLPFRVIKKDGDIMSLVSGEITVLPFSGNADTVLFLGMCCAGNSMSEWWGQNEAEYDFSGRVFLGDRLGKIIIVYSDRTQDLFPLIFGVNIWNYNLYFGRDSGGNGYDMPFSCDPQAKKLLDASLLLTENRAPDAVRGTKFVFAAKSCGKKTIEHIEIRTNSARKAGVYISAVTALSEFDNAPHAETPFFYIRKGYFENLDRLARRLYQFRDDIPLHEEKVEIDGFEGPDIAFSGGAGAEIFTNIYRCNLHDMINGKIAEDGTPRTSTPETPDYGCYTGFGTYKIARKYSGQVWTRDAGRTLTELVNFGLGERLKETVDRLHEMLYQYAIRYKIPHWKRIANIRPNDENDLHNEGKENDGHGAIMIFIASLVRKNVLNAKWISEHVKQLRDAADFFLWQIDNPEKSNFAGVLCSESEASTQIYGGYDLYSNSVAVAALESYSEIFRRIGDFGYSDRLSEAAEKLKKGCRDVFTAFHPEYGEIFTDVSEDCWTYTYKKFAPVFHFCDVYGYDVYRLNPGLHEKMTRTFMAQKEEYYNPMSGRQMGYGQAFLTQAALLLDLPDEAGDCVEAAAMLTYHHTDWKYIVPEGVICHPSGRFWFRNSDLGNGVQQSEIVKLARIIIGIDDFDCENGVRLVPRLPKNWESLSVKDFPTADGKTVSYSFSRKEIPGAVRVSDGRQSYYISVAPGINAVSARIGPFDGPEITSGSRIERVAAVNGRYYAYVSVKTEEE